MADRAIDPIQGFIRVPKEKRSLGRIREVGAKAAHWTQQGLTAGTHKEETIPNYIICTTPYRPRGLGASALLSRSEELVVWLGSKTARKVTENFSPSLAETHNINMLLYTTIYYYIAW